MVLAVSYALNSQSQSLNQGPEGRRYGASPSQKRLAEITEMIVRWECGDCLSELELCSSKYS